MRYFEVSKEIVEGVPLTGVVVRDGGFASLPEPSEPQEVKTITTGFNVWEYEEDGTTIEVQFYPVKTNFGTFENNEEEVLNQIESDHPAGEWQNDMW